MSTLTRSKAKTSRAAVPLNKYLGDGGGSVRYSTIGRSSRAAAAARTDTAHIAEMFGPRGGDTATDNNHLYY